MVLVVSMMLAIFQPPAHVQGRDSPVKHPTFSHTIQPDGLSVLQRGRAERRSSNDFPIDFDIADPRFDAYWG
jgi:hypothetical protein